MRFVAIFLCLLLTSFQVPRIVISYDGGGPIKKYRARLSAFKDIDIPVIIDGPCFSSCTMFLSLPKACITERAILLFHQGTTRHATSSMWRHWSPELRALVASYGPLPINNSGRFITIGYDDLKTVLLVC